MLRTDLLNRALKRALRQVQIRTTERFRCKEPLADEIINQFKQAVPSLCDAKYLPNLIQFSDLLKKWIDANSNVLNEYFGQSNLSPQPNRINKLQPYFVDAVFATLIRYELLLRYLPYLKKFGIGCILGGSLSYGKFFNVRQDITVSNYSDQSDIDLLVIVDYGKIRTHVKYFNSLNDSLRKINKGIGDIMYGLTPLMNILDVIKKNKQYGDYDESKIVLSKRYKVEEIFEIGKIFHPEIDKYSFPLSAHIISKDAFKLLCSPISYQEYTQIQETDISMITDIRLDYKPLNHFMVYSTMEGITVPESVSKVIEENEPIKFGTSKANLSSYKIPSYLYWEGRYVSGSYQNLILPSFEILCDDKNGTLKEYCDKFKNYLIEESMRELAIFRDSRISLSKLHPRHDNFLQSVSSEINTNLECNITKEDSVIIESYTCSSNIKTRKDFHAKYSKDQPLVYQILKIIMENPYCKVLELGCGSGSFLKLLREAGHKGCRVGVDLVDVFEYDANVAHYIKGNIENITEILNTNNYINTRFDVIVSMHVLYHVKSVSNVLEGVVSYLGSNGKFIASTNSNTSLYYTFDVLCRGMIELQIGAFYDKKYSSFSAENANEILREYFGYVTNTITETDLIITDHNDILSYIISNYDNYEIPNNSEVRNKLTSWIEKKLVDESLRKQLKDRKVVSLLVAKEPIQLDA